LTDAEVDVDLAGVHGDGGNGTAALMEADELADIEGGEQSPLVTRKVSSRPSTRDKGPEVPQGAIFETVGDVDSQMAAVLEEGAHQLGEMADGEDDV